MFNKRRRRYRWAILSGAVQLEYPSNRRCVRPLLYFGISAKQASSGSFDKLLRVYNGAAVNE